MKQLKQENRIGINEIERDLGQNQILIQELVFAYASNLVLSEKYKLSIKRNRKLKILSTMLLAGHILITKKVIKAVLEVIIERARGKNSKEE